MEEHLPLDISIRNVGVRLNDSNLDTSEMNGESTVTPFISSSEQIGETEVTRFNETSDEKYTFATTGMCDVNEKLQENVSNRHLLNGCCKLLHDDVDLSLNGLSKCSNLERINACLDQLKARTCVDEKQISRNESHRTENADCESVVSTLKNCSLTDCVKRDDKCLTDILKSTSEADSQVLPVIAGETDVNITYLGYDSESQMPDIMRLIQKDLSEPYSIYTYRYFIHNWPKLCFLAQDGNKCVGAIVCKLDVHKKHSRRGYIAMLAVDEKYRKRKIGSNLVLKAIHAMVQDNADEVVLETEITNKPALRLYENLGFVRDKRLFRYYLNGVDALRLKLWLR